MVVKVLLPNWLAHLYKDFNLFLPHFIYSRQMLEMEKLLSSEAGTAIIMNLLFCLVQNIPDSEKKT